MAEAVAMEQAADPDVKVTYEGTAERKPNQEAQANTEQSPVVETPNSEEGKDAVDVKGADMAEAASAAEPAAPVVRRQSTVTGGPAGQPGGQSPAPGHAGAGADPGTGGGTLGLVSEIAESVKERGRGELAALAVHERNAVNNAEARIRDESKVHGEGPTWSATLLAASGPGFRTSSR